MKKPVIALFAGIVLIAGVLLYPAISNPYLFICGDGTCRYNLKTIEAFYRVKFGWRVKLSEAERAERLEAYLKSRYYFRFKASYSYKHRETGELEKVDFNFVVLCGSGVPMSADGKITSSGTVQPKTFLKATSDGSALAVVTHSTCHENHRGWETHGIPDDFMPHVVLFDDVNTLDRGLGYVSEDAYESPISRLTFHGASLSRASYEEWREWREAQLAAFKPVGAIQSPWGVSNAGDEPENILSKGQFITRMGCGAYQRIKLPEELRQKVRQHWKSVPPADKWSRFAKNWVPRDTDRPEFWTQYEAGVEDYQQANEWLRLEGEKFHFTGSKSSRAPFERGVKTRAGGGAIGRSKDSTVGEYYPVISYRKPGYSGVYIIHVDFVPEKRGFANCVYVQMKEGETAEDYGFKQGPGFYIGDFLLLTGKKGRIGGHFYSRIFERDEYMWD